MTTQTAKPKVHEFETSSAAETIQAGHEIAKLLQPPKFLILRGDLGAGKTTLVKGIADALGAAEPDEVTSPTFTLIHEYEGEQGSDGHKHPVSLYHLDLYRIEGERQLDTLGIDDLVGPDSIVLVEWGEKFPSIVKRSQGEIVMVSAGGDKRKITLTLKD
jgi:tRNA threonylcarbamoyladenosine biosynthesis protein TsaE